MMRFGVHKITIKKSAVNNLTKKKKKTDEITALEIRE